MFTRINNRMEWRLMAVGCAALMMSSAPAQEQAKAAKGVKELQIEVMAKITGYVEIKPGVKLPDRCTLENRQASRDYFMEVFKELGLEGVRHAYSEDGENVYAVLMATQPTEEYVVIGAHYDSARDGCAGANDNGTGCVVVLAAAQELQKLKRRSKNYIFILFDQEERGMRGSRAFAQKLKDENMKVHSVHTVDQMGWDKDGDRAFELEIPYEGAVQLYQNARQLLGKELTIHVTTEAGSDHSAFRRLGFPAIGLTEEYRNGDTTPHIHRATDTYETIDFDYMESTTLLFIKAMELLAH